MIALALGVFFAAAVSKVLSDLNPPTGIRALATFAAWIFAVILPFVSGVGFAFAALLLMNYRESKASEVEYAE